MQKSGEDYLEAILKLKQLNGSVRSIDVAHELNFSKPSVSRAMSILKQEGHITMDEDNYIQLTPSGRQIAENIYERHRLLKEMLMAIGVSEKTASTDACLIEHVISQETVDKLQEHSRRHF